MITVAEYLFLRLKELGINDVFGVPGDYNLSFVDILERQEDLCWRGNCNELNAAYAADGYARINGFGALITTYGVGELSAMNGVAGSYAEQVPVIHIVGGPAETKQDKRQKIHHSLGNKKYDEFEKMYRHICHTTTILNFYNACNEIDRVLQDAWKYRYPVYLLLPEDVALYPVHPPREKLNLCFPCSDQDKLNRVIDNLFSELAIAKKSCVLLGEEINRYQFNKEIGELLDVLDIPFFAMWGSKGVVDESRENFYGIYRGAMSAPWVKEFIASCDVVLAFGVSWDEINTAGFTHQLPEKGVYDFHSCEASVDNVMIHAISLFDAVKKIRRGAQTWKGAKPLKPAKKEYSYISGEIKQSYLPLEFNRVITPSTVVLAETGTSLFNSGEYDFHGESQLIIAKMWASIGYATPAVLGAAIACHGKKRVVLITGDGAFQMTAQALSTMFYHNVKPIVFILNNGGYTIERMFHGANAHYNDIQPWDYNKLPDVFHGDAMTAQVSTMDELHNVIDSALKNTDKLCLIEVMLDKQDQPQKLIDFVAALKSNVKH